MEQRRVSVHARVFVTCSFLYFYAHYLMIIGMEREELSDEIGEQNENTG